MAGLVASAFADNPNGWGGSGGGGGGSGDAGAAGGDETVGTLPIVGRSTIQLPLTRAWRGDHPAFYLEGTSAELSALVLGARGAGFATVQTLDAQSGRIRIAFHGDVTVVLDRELLGTLPIQTGLAVPSTFGPRLATMQWQAGTPRSVRLRTGLLPLPIASMSADGRLQIAPLDVDTAGRDGLHSTTREDQPIAAPRPAGAASFDR